MELLDKDMNQLIDRFLRFCGIVDDNLTNSVKLSLLKKQKQLLEIEVDFYDDRSSNTNNKEIIRDCISRMEANKMVITEINMCIAYLKCVIKSDKKLQRENRIMLVKSLFSKK